MIFTEIEQKVIGILSEIIEKNESGIYVVCGDADIGKTTVVHELARKYVGIQVFLDDKRIPTKPYHFVHLTGNKMDKYVIAKLKKYDVPVVVEMKSTPKPHPDLTIIEMKK